MKDSAGETCFVRISNSIMALNQNIERKNRKLLSFKETINRFGGICKQCKCISKSLNTIRLRVMVLKEALERLLNRPKRSRIIWTLQSQDKVDLIRNIDNFLLLINFTYGFTWRAESNHGRPKGARLKHLLPDKRKSGFVLQRACIWTNSTSLRRLDCRF